MKRAAMEKPRTLKVWRKHWDSHVELQLMMGGQHAVGCPCDKQVGRFRKGQRAYKCSKPWCLGCRGEKILGKTRFRDLKRQVGAQA